MKNLVLIALAVLACACSRAAEPAAVINWTLPDKYPDGVPMPASDFERVTISWQIEGTGVLGTISVSALPPTLTIPTPCGKYIFVGRYTTTASAHVPSGTQQAPAVTFDTGKACPFPVPPGAFVVT
jgi:hypothetical protein